MPVNPSGTDSAGQSAHGTIIKRNSVAIGELKDITPPPLTRKALETTTHNSSDDSYVVGIRRKGDMTFMINFRPSGDATHSAAAAAGLINAWGSGVKDQYDVTFPDGANWLFSGFVTNIAPKAPVDGVLEASVSIRPSGSQYLTP